MKIVLDTNVVISGLLFPGGVPDRIVRAVFSGRLKNATSPDLMTEIKRILEKKFNLSLERVQDLMGLLKDVSEIVYPTERIDSIRSDESDNRILECAVTAQVDVIVSGDTRHVLPLRSYQGISILSPAAFVEKINLV